MILFCGIPTEPPLRLAIEAAVSARVSHVVVNQRLAADMDMVLDIDGSEVSGSLHIGGEVLPLDSIRGVYTRLVEPDVLPEHRPHHQKPPDYKRVARSTAFHDTLTQWLELAPCRVRNRLAAMASNVSKPYQAQIIARHGFDVPDTIISSNPAEVRAFLALHPRAVFKSVSSVRSIVRPVDKDCLARLDRIRALPTQFQVLTAGIDVRVHVVGTRVFATRIRTTAVDYRYAGRDHLDVDLTPMRLPEEVAERCMALATALNLPFCGIDLRHRPDGGWTCFEVNPSPAYSYYQDHTGQPIAEALVDDLAA